MNNSSKWGRGKMGSRLIRLFLFLAALITVPMLSYPALAQERQLDLVLSFVSGRFYLEATAGKENNFFLEVNNIGNQTLSNIRLSSEQPEGWTIDFNPSRIDTLNAGSIQTVDVTITPPRNIARGEREITIIAEANELRKVQQFWVTVKLATQWLWVGIGGVLAIAVIFILIYLRFGR